MRTESHAHFMHPLVTLAQHALTDLNPAHEKNAACSPAALIISLIVEGVAPRARLELATIRLTAGRSTN